METFVLYIFRSISKEYPSEESLLELGNSDYLVAVIQNRLNSTTLKQQINRYNLQPFEILQNNYDIALLNANKLGISISDVHFDGPIDPEIKHDLLKYFNNYEHERASETLKEVRKDYDIDAVSFVFKNRDFKISKYGVVEIDGEFQELNSLTADTPVAVITGAKSWSPSPVQSL